MTLMKINEGEVVSSGGYSIRISHNRLAYFEGDRAMSIDIDHCVNPYKLAVYRKTIKKWHPPFEKEVISNNRKSTIEIRIRECLDFLGLNYSFE